MKIFEKKFARNEYITNQISRSDDKFEYCKVRYQDVLNWYNIIKKININNISNICCMVQHGTLQYHNNVSVGVERSRN